MSELQTPKATNYDVVIVGGAMLGSSVAWFTATNPDFHGSILVVEKTQHMNYIHGSHSNSSCMRQQFSNEVNIRVSQFAADFVKNFRKYMGGDEGVPNPVLQSYGYMYLADNDEFAATLKEGQEIQAKLGAGTKHMTAEEIKTDYPF